MTSVRHSKVQSVGPERRILERSSDRGVVEESLFFHHDKLIISSNPEIGSSETHDGVISDVCKLLTSRLLYEPI